MKKNKLLAFAIMISLLMCQITNIYAEQSTARLLFPEVDTFASLSLNKTNSTSTVVCSGGNYDYYTFFRFEIGDDDYSDASYVSLDLTTYNKPSYSCDIYIYGIEGSDKYLLDNNVNGTVSSYQSLFKTDKSSIACLKSIGTAPAKNTLLSFDVTDYIKSQSDGVYCFAIRTTGLVGNYGYQFHSMRNKTSVDYGPHLSFSKGAMYEVKYDATHFKIDKYVADTENVAVDFSLPPVMPREDGFFQSNVTYISDNSSVLSIASSGEARVTPSYYEDTIVTITAFFEKEGYKEAVNLVVRVPKGDIPPQEEDDDFGNFSVSVKADFDTYIRKGTGSVDDYSDTSTMIIDGRAGSERLGVVRFYYGGNTGESLEALSRGANHITLRMKMKINDGNADIRVFGVHDEIMKTMWEDSEMNYDKAAEMNILSNRGTFAVPNIGDVELEGIGAGDYIYVDVTDYVKKEASKVAGTGSSGCFVFLICGNNALCENDLYRVSANYSGNTDDTTIPTLLAYTGNEGYAIKDSINLKIENRYQLCNNFSLPKAISHEDKAEYETKIEWSSDNESLVEISEGENEYEACVKRPDSSYVGSGAVRLNAVITNGDKEQKKSFYVYVLPVGVYNSTLTNYIYNGSDSGKNTTSPDTILSSYVSGDANRNAYVKFDVSDDVFKVARKIVLRLKPYYMRGSFDVTVRSLDEGFVSQVTDEMTWNNTTFSEHDYFGKGITFTQNPADTDWISLDVTDYVNSLVDEGAFVISISSLSEAYCMFYGNFYKNMPQLRVYNYEIASNPQESMTLAKADLDEKLGQFSIDVNNITSDVLLPEADGYGVTTMWTISDENGEPSKYIDEYGTLISQPEIGEKPQSVVFTSTLTRYGFSGETPKAIVRGRVLPKTTPEGAVDYTYQSLELDCNVFSGTGILPMGFYDTAISWSFEKESIGFENSKYFAKRFDKAYNGTLKAKISSDGTAYTREKSFDISVMPDSSINVLCNRATADYDREKQYANDDSMKSFYDKSGDIEIEYVLTNPTNVGKAIIVPYNPSGLSDMVISSKTNKGDSYCRLVDCNSLNEGINSFSFLNQSAKYIKLSYHAEDGSGIREFAAYNGENEKNLAEELIGRSDFQTLAGIPQSSINKSFKLENAIDECTISWSISNTDVAKLQIGDEQTNVEINAPSKSQSFVLTALVKDKSLMSAEKTFIIVVKGNETTSSGGGGGGGGGGTKIPSTPGADVPQESDKPENEGAFSDLVGFEWAEPFVNTLFHSGIISGRTKDLFAPGEYVTRAEFAKIIVKLFEIDTSEIKEAATFSDVSPDDWFYPYVSAAFQNGIITGINEDYFGSEQRITRQDIATIVGRALEKYKIEAENSLSPSFSDIDEISDYALMSVNKLWNLNIISGDTDGKFNPKANATRAETSKISALVLELYNKSVLEAKGDINEL